MDCYSLRNPFKRNFFIKHYLTFLLLALSFTLSADSASDRAYQNRQQDKARDNRNYENRQQDLQRDNRNYQNQQDERAKQEKAAEQNNVVKS